MLLDAAVMTLDEVTVDSVPQQPAEQLSQFDYNALPDEMGSKVQQHTLEILENLRETISIIWEVGRKLFEIRNLLKPRCFKVWLESEFPGSRSTAYNNINVYTAFQDLANIRHLPIDLAALYKLAAPSTPEDVRLKAVELAGYGEKITLTSVKSLIGSKTKKSVTSVTAEINCIHEVEVDDVVADVGEKESSENYVEFNTVTVDVVAQSVLPEEVVASCVHTSSDLVEAIHDESIFVPSEKEAKIANQNTNTSDSNVSPTYNQTSPIFTSDSNTKTNYHPATHAYNTCRTLISNLGYLNQEEVHSILRAFLQKIGSSAFSTFVKELQQEEIASFCNECLISLNEQGLNWLNIQNINFALLSDPVLKPLSVQLKRILISRGTQRLSQSQTQSEPSNLVYINAIN